MKQYTDQGKVDTRSGILFVSLVCLFVLMPALSSCWREDTVDHHVFIVEYQIDSGEKQVFDVYDYDVVGLPPNYWDLYGSWSLSKEDYLARFRMTLSTYESDFDFQLDFDVNSDTSFFYEGKKYYLSSCDSVEVSNDSVTYSKPSCALNVFFPGVSGVELVRENSWVRFSLEEIAPIWFSMDYMYCLIHYPEWPDISFVDTVTVQGALDFYYRVQGLGVGMKKVLIKRQDKDE